MSDPVAKAAAETDAAQAFADHRRPNVDAMATRKRTDHRRTNTNTNGTGDGEADRGAESRGFGAVDVEHLVALQKRGELHRPKPTMLSRTDMVKLLYPGADNYLIGMGGGGKSLMSHTAGIGVVEDGGQLTILDQEEPDPAAVLLRWMLQGGDLDLFARSVTIARAQVAHADPGKALRPGEVATFPTPWPELVAGRDLTIVDTVNASMMSFGLDPISMPDFAAWRAMIVDPILSDGGAGLLIDHLAKNQEGSTTPYGTVGKYNAARGAILSFKIGKEPAEGVDGYGWLKWEKDNGGAVKCHAVGKEVAKVNFTSLAADRLSVTIEPPNPEDTPDNTWREKVSRWAEKWAENGGEPWSLAQAKDGVGGASGGRGKPAPRVVAIGYLTDEGYLESVHTGSDRNPRYQHVKPWRKDDPARLIAKKDGDT